MLVDEITIFAKAGRGGDGVVRWLNEKGKEFSGPAGGNGGKGGDIYVLGVRDLNLLAHYRNVKEFAAENGEAGMKKSQAGKKGSDLEIKLPIGSVITNLKTRERFHVNNPGERIMILAGGNGGLGNESFKSSTNRTPEQSSPGKPGEEADLLIELELIADAGFIGFPNAGKSTLLNQLTNAKAKVGNFAFTTLEPNLGDFHGYILADIPGLIEGASDGKGLGYKFLKHVRRTKRFFHCISAESDDPVSDYKTVRNELGRFDQELLSKSETIILTKIDMIPGEILEEKLQKLMKENPDVLSVSILDDESLKLLEIEVSKRLTYHDSQ